jgi:hypothetical protein
LLTFPFAFASPLRVHSSNLHSHHDRYGGGVCPVLRLYVIEELDGTEDQVRREAMKAFMNGYRLFSCSPRFSPFPPFPVSVAVFPGVSLRGILQGIFSGEARCFTPFKRVRHRPALKPNTE